MQETAPQHSSYTHKMHLTLHRNGSL